MGNSNSLLVGWPQAAPCFAGLRQCPHVTAPLPEVTLISTAANAAGKSFILGSKKQTFALPAKPENSRREWRHLKIAHVAHKTGGGQVALRPCLTAPAGIGFSLAAGSRLAGLE